MRDFLIVFVKEPRAGQVKTRLARDLGAESAARLYRALADLEIRNTEPRPGDYERLFFFAPAESLISLRGWLGGQTLLPQRGDDLGARMSAAFDEAFGRGARRVAIIGSDVPWVTSAHVRRALDALGACGLVLGPAHDGGYYMLALDRPRPELFDGIAWSTSSVLAATRARAHELGLRPFLLEPLGDVDTLDDLRSEWPRLRPLLAKDLAADVERSLRDSESP